MPWLFLLFVAVPILEIALLLRVGAAIGWFSTLLAVILTAALGTWMLRQQGLRTLHRARGRLDAGELPAEQLVEGLVLLVGGALLLTPGFATDAAGFLCLIPASRQWLARRLGERARLQVGGVGFGGAASPHGAADGKIDDAEAPNAARPTDPRGTGAPGRRRGSGDIIDGEYERLD